MGRAAITCGTGPLEPIASRKDRMMLASCVFPDKGKLMTRTCPSCGTAFDAGSRCPRCGKQMSRRNWGWVLLVVFVGIALWVAMAAVFLYLLTGGGRGGP